MKTSYYMSAKLRAGRDAGNLAIVQISQGLPRWKYCQPDWNMEALIPLYDRYAGHDAAELRRQYFAQLTGYGLANIQSDLAELAKVCAPAEPVLCCHEKDANGCHRRWLAEWIVANGGEMISEL